MKLTSDQIATWCDRIATQSELVNEATVALERTGWPEKLVAATFGELFRQADEYLAQIEEEALDAKFARELREAAAHLDEPQRHDFEGFQAMGDELKRGADGYVRIPKRESPVRACTGWPGPDALDAFRKPKG